MDKDLAVLLGVTLIGIIGVAILSPAFPEIKRGLNLSDFEVAMLVTVFTLPGIFVAPLMGVLADRFGRKKVLIPSLFLFGVAGTACAFVNFKLMLIFRFLQGIGGSALTSLVVTLIGDMYDGLKRIKALGYNACALSLGLASYPIIGGLLAELNWRYPFLTFISAIPIGLLAMRLRYPDIKQGSSLPRYIKNSFDLFRDKYITLCLFSGCVVFIITSGTFVMYIPILLQNEFNLPPSLRGLIQSFSLLITALIAFKINSFVKTFGYTGTIKLGFISYAISLIIIFSTPSLYLFVVAMMIFGIGHGTVLPSLQNLIVTLAPTENRAVITTTYGSMIRVGQTIGPILASTVAMYSIKYVFLVSTILSLCLVIVNHFIKLNDEANIN